MAESSPSVGCCSHICNSSHKNPRNRVSYKFTNTGTASSTGMLPSRLLKSKKLPKELQSTHRIGKNFVTGAHQRCSCGTLPRNGIGPVSLLLPKFLRTNSQCYSQRRPGTLTNAATLALYPELVSCPSVDCWKKTCVQ